MVAAKSNSNAKNVSKLAMPSAIRKLFEPAPVLASEKEKFFDLVAAISAVEVPENELAWIWVMDFACYQVEKTRLLNLKSRLLEMQMLARREEEGKAKEKTETASSGENTKTSLGSEHAVSAAFKARIQEYKVVDMLLDRQEAAIRTHLRDRDMYFNDFRTGARKSKVIDY